MVLVVVELHGCLVDVGLEGGVVVGQRGKFVGHGDLLLFLIFVSARSVLTGLVVSMLSEVWTMHPRGQSNPRR
jgi:hypothetical protein